MSETDRTTTLSPGETGPAVDQLQEQLVWLGYDTVEVTSHYDHATESAVREYQYARGIAPTGVCDESTHGYIAADMMTGHRPGPFTRFHETQEANQARWEQMHPGEEDDQPRMYSDGSVKRPSEHRREEVEEHLDRIRHPLGHAEPGEGPKEGTPGGPLP